MSASARALNGGAYLLRRSKAEILDLQQQLLSLLEASLWLQFPKRQLFVFLIETNRPLTGL